MNAPVWEAVTNPHNSPEVARLPVPGGWLYAAFGSGGTVNVVFVPTPTPSVFHHYGVSGPDPAP